MKQKPKGFRQIIVDGVIYYWRTTKHCPCFIKPADGSKGFYTSDYWSYDDSESDSFIVIPKRVAESIRWYLNGKK